MVRLMSVINASQFSLIRARRELEKAYIKKDWNGVKYWDEKLGEFLDLAFEDEDRDTRVLIDELETILQTYGKVVSSLVDNNKTDWFMPDNG